MYFFDFCFCPFVELDFESLHFSTQDVRPVVGEDRGDLSSIRQEYECPRVAGTEYGNNNIMYLVLELLSLLNP